MECALQGANYQTKAVGKGRGEVHRTKPEKKKLIQAMITVCGINMTILLFIIFIIASIPPGSVKGFAGGAPLFYGSFKYSPFWNAACRKRLLVSTTVRGMT